MAETREPTGPERDESKQVEINVDQRDYDVSARHDGETWRATVERSPV